MNAAETFVTTAHNIVKKTGCTPEAAVAYLMDKMLTERPELALRVAVSAGLVTVS